MQPVINADIEDKKLQYATYEVYVHILIYNTHKVSKKLGKSKAMFICQIRINKYYKDIPYCIFIPYLRIFLQNKLFFFSGLKKIHDSCIDYSGLQKNGYNFERDIAKKSVLILMIYISCEGTKILFLEKKL